MAELASGAAPSAGDKALDAAQNEVGQIVRVAPNLVGGFDVLTELRIDAKEAGAVYCNGSALSFKTLPYNLNV